MFRKVNLICAHLVDQTTGEALQGGAERYTVELAKLLHSKGMDVQILHKARRAFETSAAGFRVRGLPAPQGALGNPLFSLKAAEACGEHQLQIYVLADLAFPRIAGPAIGIQHGIWWESDYSRLKRTTNKIIQSRLTRTFDAYVCVDTAFINWLYAEIPGRARYAHKLRYIPNFAFEVDDDLKPRAVNEEPRILFPRRMEYFRGAMWFYEAMKALWVRGKRYRAVFCGPGSLTDCVRQRAASEGYGHLAEFRIVEMDDMREEYTRADVAVVPTIAREGTSLACIEAMAFGCPVVVSHVGGLGNLVIPGVNGLMVDLRHDELARAIELLVENPSIRERVRRNGLETAKMLSLDNWRSRWWTVVESLDGTRADKTLFPDSGSTAI